MYIEQISISNYKSFYESGVIEFTPGFNVIVGSNNAGKTALVEALSLRFANKPHKSQRTIPHPGAKMKPASTVAGSFRLNPGEVRQLLIDGTDNFLVPSPHNSNAQEMADNFLASLNNPDSFRFVCENGQMPNHGYLTSIGMIGSATTLAFEVDRENREVRFTNVQAGGLYNSHLTAPLQNLVYAFDAERLKVGESQIGPAKILMPNASNLAEVLHNLQSNQPRYNRYNKLVREIFPEIGLVSAPTTEQGNRTRILLWPANVASTEREDLAIPLSESGTGIGQVLAILYVVLTSDFPRVIIIDEPQSFLNPGATRKLMEILKQHQGHQFIVTTHSPEVITAASPRTLMLLKKEGAETRITRLDANDAQELRIVLAEVGARLSDVFGADHILWVEGATEELCFPLIVDKVLQRRLMGTKIVGVLHTGDFETDDPERIVQIYRRLSEGSSLLPPAIGFLFDRETRTQAKREDITRMVRNMGVQMQFTQRTMYENYLLNPQAIAAVTSTIEGFRDTPISPEEVKQGIESLQGDKAFFDPRITEAERSGDNWIKNVYGAKVVSKLFSTLSEQRVRYDKKVHGLALTEWIIEHSPHDLDEVTQLLATMVPAE